MSAGRSGFRLSKQGRDITMFHLSYHLSLKISSQTSDTDVTYRSFPAMSQTWVVGCSEQIWTGQNLDRNSPCVVSCFPLNKIELHSTNVSTATSPTPMCGSFH